MNVYTLAHPKEKILKSYITIIIIIVTVIILRSRVTLFVVGQLFLPPPNIHNIISNPIIIYNIIN